MIEECDKSKSSITEDAVFVLETFGKVYQYNGLKCNPVERHEGRKKLLEVCKNIENSNDGTRTKAIDFEIVMQTVMQTSKGETLFFKVLAGNGTCCVPSPAWPLSLNGYDALEATCILVDTIEVLPTAPALCDQLHSSARFPAVSPI